ncbi:MAG TPA: calcium/sodium antiporter [Bacillota bacterium]|jgi:cation:H+ antiporter|nr:calcium/sodium antiporter [Bacillota bacterium]HRU41273.1 calcium/sodium antiporter [Candidatus Diapherotrites archaeon]HQE65963.1 calcium/sodium antiporter [Bacillota bacterium]HQI15408.1 calcium/sodium antiporter [Bacillota bacterium]HQJ37838.1 calcium/sodium antiporter [Bacillota bacterium]
MWQFIEKSNLIVVLTILAVSLYVLSKAADFLVDNAVKLSKAWGLSEIIIGVTIVSFGTTLPELSASIVSALQGNGDFALGNAVGSCITNTSLILGSGALFGKIPIDKKSSQKLSILIAAVALLILPTFPYKIVNNNGRIPQIMGIVFLLLIPAYVYYLILQDKDTNSIQDSKPSNTAKGSAPIIIKIFLAAFIITTSASALVSSAEVLAGRIGIPDVIISSTLVAFGTSVPELSTCIAAVKNNHGELAIGNILGANILNILLVTGASVALTPGGIEISEDFYSIHFAALVVVLLIYGIFAYNKKSNEISKREGIILILIYAIYIGANLFSTV